MKSVRLLLIVLLLAGCGQKGPLYFPDAGHAPATPSTPHH